MNLSYWELNTWFQDIDFAVIGSGIVGLNCALQLRKIHPKGKIVVFEKGILPSGASTKNAGFACFGSISEILDDLKTHSENEVIALVKERTQGLELLRRIVGDEVLRLKNYGGYELFSHNDNQLYQNCINKIAYVNNLLKEVFSSKAEVFKTVENSFSFNKVQSNLIFNSFESQLDTGAMMSALIKKAATNNILIINNTKITAITSNNDKVTLQLNNQLEISVHKVCIATNGFAKQFIDKDLQPARAQVVITKPIKNLKVKGTFHLDKGYYYFRNINDRILFGGGRNLDFNKEETTKFGLTKLVQDKLEIILKETILPNTPFEIEHKWSGIMGVGPSKKPILEQVKPNVFCGVRLGGMGVAIGSTIGKNLANLVK